MNIHCESGSRFARCCRPPLYTLTISPVSAINARRARHCAATILSTNASSIRPTATKHSQHWSRKVFEPLRVLPHPQPSHHHRRRQNPMLHRVHARSQFPFRRPRPCQSPRILPIRSKLRPRRGAILALLPSHSGPLFASLLLLWGTTCLGFMTQSFWLVG